jgi:dihydroorotase
MPMKTLKITAPDDFHTHLRDTDALTRTVSDQARQCDRALVMPNLKPAIITIDRLVHYYERIKAHIPEGLNFTPLMTLYLTQSMHASTITEAANKRLLTACKYYPAGGTTNAEHGVKSLKDIPHLLGAMQHADIPLCLHGEVITDGVDIFDRETRFVETELTWLLENYPNLRIVLEHVSTKAAVDFVSAAPKNVAATITAHHLLLNRNDMLMGGIRPDYYCLPILKTQDDQAALIRAATSGNPKFFMGTDSAPHSVDNKHTACGCAGIYTAHAAIELYATAFEKANALEKLGAFTSHFGADFYKLQRNTNTITLVHESWTVPTTLDFGSSTLTPFFAGQTLHWKRK